MNEAMIWRLDSLLVFYQMELRWAVRLQCIAAIYALWVFGGIPCEEAESYQHCQ